MRSAECLFLEKGVEPTTIEDITLRASVSKGAFYLHFSSKADVVEALRVRFVQQLLDSVNEEVAMRSRDDWTGKLTGWANACAVGYLNATRLHHLIFAAAPLPTRNGLTNNLLIDHLADLLITGNHEKAWSLANPGFTAIFLFNALHGVVNREGIGESELDRRKLLHDIEDHFRRVVN
ncbi:TetR family transcriptional regulator [Rhizobium sp. Pop5]|nr:TetR family transcriptional regulator [Rhizobium sp. Pop5]